MLKATKLRMLGSGLLMVLITACTSSASDPNTPEAGMTEPIEIPADYVAVTIDIGDALDRDDPEPNQLGERQFEISPDDVSHGSSDLILSAKTGWYPDGGDYVEVRFRGRWPNSGRYPAAFDSDGELLQIGSLGEGCNETAIAAFVPDAEAVQQLTFVLGPSSGGESTC